MPTEEEILKKIEALEKDNQDDIIRPDVVRRNNILIEYYKKLLKEE